MNKILIDLDVLTNALWKGENKEAAKRFLDSIVKEDIEILTPSVLIEIKTFNKKHLVNKKTEINQILRRFNLREVEINEPI